MDISDHLAKALGEERVANSKRLNLLRFGGVSCFLFASIAISIFHRIEIWTPSHIGLGIYTLIAALLLIGGRFSNALLALSRVAVPVFDMPMVFFIQMLHIGAAQEAGADPRVYSEFSVALYICLLMLSAYTLNVRFILGSVVIAIGFQQALHALSGASIDSRLFGATLLLFAAWICHFAGRNRIAMVEKVAAANTRRIRLQRYFSPGVGELLEQWDEDEISLGQECEITVIFIDIRGFTAMSESMSGREIVKLLNSYHSHMVEAIFRNGGTLDKYLGDGLIAYFNSPVEQPDHAVRAVRCARDMRSELALINKERESDNLAPIRMGIGIHTGVAIVGDIGAPHRREFTAIGTAVNVAARLEGLTKTLNREIVVSESTKSSVTRSSVDEVEWDDLGEHQIRGCAEPLAIFSPARN